MKKSRAARKRQVKSVVIGVCALAFFLSALAGAGYYLATRHAGLDRDTLCPKEGPSGHIVLLVDKTDPLNFTQKQAFLGLLQDLVDRRIEPGYLVSVFVLGEDYKQSAKPIVEICNPGSGEGKSELTANVAKLNAQFRERFRQPLLAQAEVLVSTTPSKTSAILEMLQLVAINGFSNRAINGPRRLIIVSDMLHNTPGLSMYQAIPDYGVFAASDYGRKMRAELPGVEVELHHVLNMPKLQNRRQLEFWETYFSKSGARLISVRPMEG